MSIDNVNDLTPRAQYSAATSQVEFPYPFPIFSNADLVVDVDGVIQALTDDYTVSDAGADTGGDVTFVAPMVGGEIVTIYRDIAIQRTSDFQQNGPWSSVTTNDELDKITLILQQLEARLGRSIRIPITGLATDASIELSPISNWFNKFITLNSQGIPEPSSGPSGTPLTRSSIGDAFQPLTSAESAAGVVTADIFSYYAPYNLLRYKGLGDNSTNNVNAIAKWTAACNQADAEGVIPEGTYKIFADVTLPKKVHSAGKFTGAFKVIYTQKDFGYVQGKIDCEKFYVSGAYFCDIENIRASTSILVDGSNNSWGTFWCRFMNWNTPSLTIDITKFSVNLNMFSGLIRYIHLTGDRSLYAASEAHANIFDMVDASNNSLPSFGVLQDDVARQVNTIRGLYMENGSQIRGNWHIVGQHGDLSQPPLVDDLKHILFSTQHTEKNCKDFFSLATFNLARGGQWDWLDTSGKPVCLSHSGGTSVSVQTDLTGPKGITKRYQATFSSAFGNFPITIQPSNVDRIAISVYYKSTDDFAAIECSDGVTTISLGHEAVVTDLANNWKLLRLTVRASKTATTGLTLYAHTSPAGAAKTISIGGIFVGSEAAAVYPTNNDAYNTIEPVDSEYALTVNGVVVQSGQKDQTTTASSPVDISFTYPKDFANNPSVTFSLLKTGSNTQNMTKAYLTAISTHGATVRVEFATNFDGRLYWQAIGRRA